MLLLLFCLICLNIIKNFNNNKFHIKLQKIIQINIKRKLKNINMKASTKLSIDKLLGRSD